MPWPLNVIPEHKPDNLELIIKEPYTKLPKPMEGVMPKKLEERLRKEGQAKGLTGKRLDAYIYGALRKTGWEPPKKKER